MKKKFSESPSLLYYNSVLKPSRKQLFDWYRSISFWEPKRKWFQLFLIIIFHYYTSAENWKNHKKSFFPYYSKTFVVTFLKYKIDPDSLLTQHDLFRTRKNRVIWNIFVCVCDFERGDSRFHVELFFLLFSPYNFILFYHNIIRLWSYLLRIKISLIFMLMLIMVQWVAFFDIFSYTRPSKEIWNENRGTYQARYVYVLYF